MGCGNTAYYTGHDVKLANCLNHVRPIKQVYRAQLCQRCKMSTTHYRVEGWLQQGKRRSPIVWWRCLEEFTVNGNQAEA